MTAKLQYFDISDSADNIISAIEDDGGVIVTNFLAEELKDKLINELAPHADGFHPGIEGGLAKQFFSGDQTKRFSGLAARAPAFADVIDHELLHSWAEHGFKNDYWVNTGQAIIIGPKSEAQMLHRDVGNWPIMMAQGKNGPEATLSSMIALTDFTKENGATQVVPGSHKWEDYEREAQPDEIVQAEMPAGSALLYTGRVIHGGGANISESDWRFGIHLSFVLAQLTPEEAHPITVPWEVAQNYSERVQHMLGYHSHRSFLPDWAVLWTADYRDVRDCLTPARREEYVSSGAKHLQELEL